MFNLKFLNFMRTKKAIFYTLLFIVGFLLGTAIAQAQSVEQNIIGKWQVDKSNVKGLVDDAIKRTKDKNPERAAAMEAQRDSFEAMIANSIIEYRADKTYTIDTPGGGQQSGTWKISEGGKKLIRIGKNAEEAISEIVEAGSNKLIIINPEKRKLTYYKQ